MVYDKTKEWQPYLCRPFTLLGVSLWHRWYNSESVHGIIGKKVPSTLCVGDGKGSFTRYTAKQEFEDFTDHFHRIVEHDPDKAEVLLDTSMLKSREAIALIADNDFLSFQAAAEKLEEFFVFNPLVPVLTLWALEKSCRTKGKLFEKALALRRLSFYQKFLKEIVYPLAEKEAAEYGLPADAAHLMTYTELLNKEVSQIGIRRQAVEHRKHFMYQHVGGKETVAFLDNPEIIPKPLDDDVPRESVRGKSAYPGRIRGRAKIITSYDHLPADIAPNTIIIAVNTNPILLPVIEKASAIVTDEGGIISHAAIIARELKKPCVIGTKTATKTFKDGDYLEIDALRGIVRKIA